MKVFWSIPIALIVLLAVASPTLAAFELQPSRISLTIGGGPAGTDRAYVSGYFALSAASNEIALERQVVSVQLAALRPTPTGPNLETFYKVAIPAGGLDTGVAIPKFVDVATRYQLNDYGRQATGLEHFQLVWNSDGSGTFSLIDARASIPNADYGSVALSLTIGAETGSAGTTLVQTGGVWQIN